MTALPAAQRDNIEPRVNIAVFEDGSIDPNLFDHEAHVYIGWLYLQECELIEAIGRFCASLKRLTRKLGIEAKYHETITWFFLIVIQERIQATMAPDWPSFKRSNPDLFATSPSIIRRHYSRARLESTLARTQFLLPDRFAL